MIKAVFFDIDNTVYNYDISHEYAMTKLYDYCYDKLAMTKDEVNKGIKDAKVLCDSRLGKVCAATHNRLIRFQTVLEMLKKPLFPYAYEMEKCYWNSLIDFAKPESGIEKLMKELKQKGVFIGVGTNMTADWQFVKLQRFNLGQYIDAIVTSEEVSEEKPNKKLFEVCVQKAGVKPEECVFIGDSIKNDIEGAESVGMKTILYTGCLKEEKAQKLYKSGYACVNSFDKVMDIINEI